MEASDGRECTLCEGTAKVRRKYSGYICWFCEKDFKYRFGRWMKRGEAFSIIHSILSGRQAKIIEEIRRSI